jgi:predicted aspartyl protease
MGLVKGNAHIRLRQDSLQEVEFLVDTGSFYTFLPPGLAADLGITFPVTTTGVLADSRTREVPVGVAYLHLAEREGGIIVGELEVPMPLLGASALEILGPKVNPVDETMRIQIFAVAELLEGKQPELPGRVDTFARTPRLSRGGRQMALSEPAGKLEEDGG